MSATVRRLSHIPAVRKCREVIQTLFSRKYLLYTNTAISMTLSCAGDGLQQNYQIVKKEMNGWNFRRSRDVAITGLLIGPFCHYWYIFLDWWLPGRTIGIVAKKLVVDQFICSPVVIGSFLITTSLLEGKKGQELKSEVMEKGKLLYKAEWVVWPPAQAFNFWVMPLKFRVLFDTMVSFGFDWYFSAVKYRKNSQDSEEYSYIDSAELNQFIASVQFCGTGAHVPFVHIQAAELVQIGLERKQRQMLKDGTRTEAGVSKERSEHDKQDVLDTEVQKVDHHITIVDRTEQSQSDLEKGYRADRTVETVL